jgi:SLT domain-containing protein
MGQLLLRNVDRYYPDGRAGIGNPMSEAIGMLRYIQDRYGSPERAWAQYGRRHEGY